MQGVDLDNKQPFLEMVADWIPANEEPTITDEDLPEPTVYTFNSRDGRMC